MNKHFYIIFITIFILINMSCSFKPMRTCKLYENKDSLKHPNSMIIMSGDTFYCNRYISGRIAPNFSHKINGLYYEVRTNGSIRYKSYVLKGKLQGLYLAYDENNKLSEDGYFIDGYKFIVNRF